MSGALEDERNALLERMHASRKTYRSELTHAEEQVQAPIDADVFPRSETFKFIKRHPYYASLGLLAALSIMPRMPLRRAVKSGAVARGRHARQQCENFSDAPGTAVNGALVAVAQPCTMNSTDASNPAVAQPADGTKQARYNPRGFPRRTMMGKYFPAWLLGVPALVLIIVYLLLN